MFRKLTAAYADLVAAVAEYAASWRAAARRVRELHGVADDNPAPDPARVLNGRAKGTAK